MNPSFLVSGANMNFYLFVQKFFPTSDCCSSLNHANTLHIIRNSIRKTKSKKKGKREKKMYVQEEHGKIKYKENGRRLFELKIIIFLSFSKAALLTFEAR